MRGHVRNRETAKPRNRVARKPREAHARKRERFGRKRGCGVSASVQPSETAERSLAVKRAIFRHQTESAQADFAYADWQKRQAQRNQVLYSVADDEARAARAAKAEIAAKRDLVRQARANASPDAPLICNDGALYVAPDFDDTPVAATADGHVEVQAAQLAEVIFLRYCARETGVEANTPRDVERQAEKDELKRQSHEIASALGRAGVDAYRNDMWQLWRYRPLSGSLEELPKFRRKMIIPHVAAMVRAPMVSALEYFLERNPHARFLTLTSGTRCTLDELDARLDEHLEKLGTFNEWLRRKWGWQLVFRATELGTPEVRDGRRVKESEAGLLERDEAGKLTLHVHTHAVIDGPYLEPAAFSRMLSEFWEHWDHWLGDGGVIRDARECCKYLVKPGQILKMTPEELAQLDRALYRRKLVSPLGKLRDEIRVREDARLVLRRYRLPNGEGSVWKEEPNHNRRHRQTPDQLDMEAGAKLGSEKQGGCFVVSRCVPTRGALGLKEPSVVVMGTQWNEAHVRKHHRIKEMLAVTKPQWHRALFDRKHSMVRVHTCTPTPAEPAGLLIEAGLSERSSPADPLLVTSGTASETQIPA